MQRSPEWTEVYTEPMKAAAVTMETKPRPLASPRPLRWGLLIHHSAASLYLNSLRRPRRHLLLESEKLFRLFLAFACVCSLIMSAERRRSSSVSAVSEERFVGR